MGRRRKLTRDDEILWDRVARGTRRLTSDLPTSLPAEMSLPPADRPAMRLPTAPERQPERPGQRVILPSSLTQPPAAKVVLAQPPTDPLRMDHRLHGRMVRGKLAPEARLDLHGMTLAQAHGRLNSFILNAVARGQRLVLVITGKGRRARAAADEPVTSGGQGALRREVPHWLRSAPLKAHVLNTHVAHRSHGGDGALYVYLRRQA
ncbi:MAG: Smr/MutS family protein [Pararhodobacter sp.]